MRVGPFRRGNSLMLIFRHKVIRGLHTQKTEEHWNFLSEVKNILKDTLDISKLGLKHTTSYTAVLYEQNVRKWICRVKINDL